MACFHPLKGHYASFINKDTGKRPVVFGGSDVFYDRPINVPCGICIGCRLERSRQWAIRCVHEASLYESNCFITLTFRESCPLPGSRDFCYSLCKDDFPLFMKRLRKRIAPVTVRYFHCGEYGDQYSRPHHHACLFGYDFPDKEIFKEGKIRLYRSAMLEDLWPHGYSTIGDVTFDSAAYVARYCLKKLRKLKGKDLYDAMVNPKYCGRVPEYVSMSLKPGIGDAWFSKYSSDLFPKDFVVLRGKRMKIPKFYNKKFKLHNSHDYDSVVANRVMQSRGSEHLLPDRLEDAEIIMKQRCEQLTRQLEVTHGDC